MPALPNLIVIGSMKCGTSSLHEYLSCHGSIGMSEPKEVNFFSGEMAGAGLQWYRGLFDETKIVRGESSQSYSKGHHPLYAGAPKRINELIQDCKLIYLVRDPIERYLSHIADNYFNESEHDRQWNLANEHYVKTGLYHYQLQFFLSYFSLNQIMIVDLADLQNDRLKTMNTIFDFLGVSHIQDPDCFDFIVNKHEGHTVSAAMRRNILYRTANKLSPNLTDRLVRTRLVKSTLLTGVEKQELGEKERAALVARFRPDVDKLRTLLGREFAGWSV